VRYKESEYYFAMKKINKSILEDKTRHYTLSQVRLEKAILNRINHPFIVTLYKSFEDEKGIYLIFEHGINSILFFYLLTLFL